MIVSILTLFPEMFTGSLSHSIIGRAQKKHLVIINMINIRDFATDKYRSVDDRPYGGGRGMILKVDVLDRALINAKKSVPHLPAYTILLDPKGKIFNQQLALNYRQKPHLILICGHYEGIDARVNKLVDEVVSIGEFVLTGGEIPAMLIIDSVTRLIPGVIRNGVTDNESFTDGMFEAPQYTRPQNYKKLKVPSVLLEGNHAKINDWRKKHTLKASSVTS